MSKPSCCPSGRGSMKPSSSSSSAPPLICDDCMSRGRRWGFWTALKRKASICLGFLSVSWILDHILLSSSFMTTCSCLSFSTSKAIFSSSSVSSSAASSPPCLPHPLPASAKTFTFTSQTLNHVVCLQGDTYLNEIAVIKLTKNNCGLGTHAPLGELHRRQGHGQHLLRVHLQN